MNGLRMERLAQAGCASGRKPGGCAYTALSCLLEQISRAACPPARSLQGCSACANGIVLTVDVEARSTRRGAVVYSAQPARCQRCAADLGCAGCEDWAGCTSCPAGSIRTGTTGTANYTRCVACKSLGCASCEDGVGCTVCPPGSFLFSSLGAGMYPREVHPHCMDGWPRREVGVPGGVDPRSVAMQQNEQGSRGRGGSPAAH